MSNTAFSTPPEIPYQESDYTSGKKKSGWGCIGYGCGCGCLGFILFLLLGGIGAYFYCIKGKPMVVSPETTVITEPLKTDGKSVDFYQAIQKMTEPDIPAEENGFRLVLQLYGQAMFKAGEPEEERMYAEMCKKLNLDPAKQVGAVLLPWDTDGKQNEFNERQNWLNLVSPGLDIVRTAVAKPHYFVPLIRQNEHEIVLIAQPKGVHAFHQQLSDALRHRAKFRFESGQTEQAWQDILASIRLFRFASPFQLVPLANGIAVNGGDFVPLAPVEEIRGTLAHWSPAQLDQAIKDLESLPEWTDPKTMLRTLQFYLLDIMSSGENLSDVVSRFGNEIPPEAERMLRYIGFNWNITAKELNAQVNYEALLDKAGGDPNNLSALSQILGKESEKLAGRGDWKKKPVDFLVSNPSFNPVTTSGRSKLAGLAAGSGTAYTVGNIVRLQLTEESRCQALRLMLAIERHRRQHGFPENLEQLGLPPMKRDMKLRLEKSPNGYFLVNEFFNEPPKK